MQLTWLHIPKTGGTAIKYLQHEHRRQWFAINPHGHTLTLPRSAEGRPLAFAIRDPWQRFCSGFWERATTNLRMAAHREHKLPGFGYREVRADERVFYRNFPTPNDMISGLRKGECRIPARSSIEEMTAPIMNWLGDLDTYRKHQHKVSVVVDIKDLDAFVQEITGHALPRDPFRRRSRDLFDIPQSYDIDADNLEWFQTQYRAGDYALLDHIRSQPYFRQFG